jgi:hypothetical protein
MKYIEYKRLKDEKDGFTLDNVTDVQEAFVDKFLETYWSKEKLKGKLM